MLCQIGFGRRVLGVTIPRHVIIRQVGIDAEQPVPFPVVQKRFCEVTLVGANLNSPVQSSPVTEQAELVPVLDLRRESNTDSVRQVNWVMSLWNRRGLLEKLIGDWDINSFRLCIIHE